MAAVPVSEHFTVEELAGGVFAVIAGDSGAAVSNAGIIDLGGTTLVFDTFMTPAAGADLLAAAVTLTGREPVTVVNSHFHADHIRGNQLFAGRDIIATARTIELIAANAPDRNDYETEVKAWLAGVEQQLAAGADLGEREREFLRMQERMAQAVLASLPDLAITLPIHALGDRLDVAGTDRRAVVLNYGGGHTESDCFLHLPEDGIVFMGDLLFSGAHAWAGDGDPRRWANILAMVRALKAAVAVPGHGPVVPTSYLDEFGRYLRLLDQVVEELSAAGAGAAQAERVGVPSSFRDWRHPQRFSQSIAALLARQPA